MSTFNKIEYLPSIYGDLSEGTSGEFFQNFSFTWKSFIRTEVNLGGGNLITYLSVPLFYKQQYTSSPNSLNQIGKTGIIVEGALSPQGEGNTGASTAYFKGFFSFHDFDPTSSKVANNPNATGYGELIYSDVAESTNNNLVYLINTLYHTYDISNNMLNLNIQQTTVGGIFGGSIKGKYLLL